MQLTISYLKNFIPDLNAEVIEISQLIEAFNHLGFLYYEIPLRRKGYCVKYNGEDLAFVKYGMAPIESHEVIAHELVHAVIHAFASQVLTKHHTEAEAIAVICLMPITRYELLIQHAESLDFETYELLKKRRDILDRWKI